MTSEPPVSISRRREEEAKKREGKKKIGVSGIGTQRRTQGWMREERKTYRELFKLAKKTIYNE